MAPKSKPKSMLSSKGSFLKKHRFPLRKIHFFEIRGVEVGSKNRPKIDVKNDAETERLENSILIDFSSIWEPSWPSKTEPRRSKIDVEMASKFDQFLKASWNAIFSPKRRLAGPWMVWDARLGGMRRVLGEDNGGVRRHPLGEQGVTK